MVCTMSMMVHQVILKAAWLLPSKAKKMTRATTSVSAMEWQCEDAAVASAAHTDSTDPLHV